MRELIIPQFDAFLTWAGFMFLIYAAFWCRRSLHILRSTYMETYNVALKGNSANFFERLDVWRSSLTDEGRCWATIGAATASLWTAAAWMGWRS